MSIERLSGGLTPGDGSDPRTFPEIFNGFADEFEEVQTRGFRFVGTVYFTSNGTFSKGDFPFLRAIRVKVQGAGGGGGGAGETASTQSAVGTGGGGGAYGEIFITDLDSVSSSANVIVGAGGSVSAGANGTSGGDSNFDGIGAVGGGTFGEESTRSGAGFRRARAGVTAPSGYDLAIGGNAGHYGFVFDAGSFTGQVAGQGGTSKLGSVGRADTVSTSTASRGFGSGGGGAAHGGDKSAIPGVEGQPGIVIVELFA